MSSTHSSQRRATRRIGRGPRSPRLRLAAFVLCAGLASAASATMLEATDYYVSPTGRDSNTGTSPQTAWKTINKVNSRNFQPGDRIFFEGGASFSGNLYFDAADVGTPTSPIVVSSYGTGRARILAGKGFGLYAYNTSGYVVANLKFEGSGVADDVWTDGVSFFTDLPNNVKLPFIRIQDVEVSGFDGFGVMVGSWNGRTGYRDVRLVRVVAHENRRGGILTFARTRNVHENVYIGDSRAYNNPGDPNDSTRNSGSGIVMGAVNGGIIERCIAYGNGTQGRIPNAIWTYDTNAAVVQYNEAYNNHTATKTDGGGFALDISTSNSVLQYNWSHDNDGAGYLLAHRYNNDVHSGNVVRYNISQNDARKNGNAGIKVWGRVVDTEIHNNTIFMSPAPSGQPRPRALVVHNGGITKNYVKSLHIRNNILQTTRGVHLAMVSSYALAGAVDLRFQGNDYYSSGAGWRVKWGGTVYKSLTAWRNGTGQERVGTVATGFDVDPKLTNPGGGGTIGNPDQLTTLGAYRLQSSSPMVDAGLDLPLLFGVNVGPRDYYGSSIPQGPAYDVGAHELRK